MQVLDLSSNALTEWPLPAGRLPRLRQLDLSGNARLLSAPEDALQCCADTLQSLRLSGRPLALRRGMHAVNKAALSIWSPSFVTLLRQSFG
jgi:Leucine-rich repeat (LRR) protein